MIIKPPMTVKAVILHLEIFRYIMIFMWVNLPGCECPESLCTCINLLDCGKPVPTLEIVK